MTCGQRHRSEKQQRWRQKGFGRVFIIREERKGRGEKGTKTGHTIDLLYFYIVVIPLAGDLSVMQI